MTVAIATALAGRAVEVASEPVRTAVAELSRRVRERFRGHPSDEAALARADEEPEVLQGTVQRILDDDPDFRSELQTLWNQAHTEAVATEDGVVNIFNGHADKMIQLRDVHGDLHIN
ncbi:hypothetical protein GCM10022254_06800 [Actinomadura meridiana]|uniref:Uncharacterized protein n=1 Tax=Actinomadura meridiana TaxID=559626 RepID=A0ABP8BSZ6_9ACTN